MSSMPSLSQVRSCSTVPCPSLLGPRSGCGGCGLGAGAGTFLGGGGDRVVPESAIPAAGRKGRLWRRFYYLQYLKLLYNKLKTEYAR